MKADRPDTTPGTGGGEKGNPLPRFHSDFAVAITTFVFCAVAYYVTTTFDEAPVALAQGMQPPAFPRLVLGVMLLLAGVIAMQALGQRDEKRRPLPAMTYITIGAMFAFLLITRWLDIFLAIIVFCSAVPLLWGTRRYLTLLLYVVGVPVAVYIIFGVVLEVRFPRGVLTNLIY